jgi:hypothetical protein
MGRFLIQEYTGVDVGLLRASPDHLYVIDITLDHEVCTSDAALLQEPNTCGIPVRRSFAPDSHAAFSDQEHEREALIAALRKLYRTGRNRPLRMPQAGIGAGSFALATHSPAIHGDLCRILADHFGYRHPSALATTPNSVTCSSRPYHHEIFAEVCTRGGLYMTQQIAEKHGLTLEQLKAHCLAAGNELDALGKLYPLHRPIYRWANGE